MLQTTAVKLREDFDREVERCIDNHETLKVTRDSGENLVIIGEADWRAIEETLYLNRIPGLVESIREAAREPLSEGINNAPIFNESGAMALEQTQRTVGEYVGRIRMADDFNAPLPDGFWTGESN